MSLTLGASYGPARADATQDLYRAVHADDLAAVKASLSAGADPTTRDRDGLTPAMLADELGHRAIARYLRDAAPATEGNARSESARDHGFLDRLLARVTTRRQAEPVKVSIPIAAAPDKARAQKISLDKAREQSTAPDKVPVPVPAPVEVRDSAPPPATTTANATEPAMAKNAAPNQVEVEAQAKTDGAAHNPPRAAAPRRERQAAKAAPRFAFPLPPHKPAIATPEAVAADAPNNPFDPASEPLGSVLAVIDDATPPSFIPPAAEASLPPAESRETVIRAATEADGNSPAPVASSTAPTAATTRFPSEVKTPNAFDRFLSSLFGMGGERETSAAPDKARLERSAPDKARLEKAAPPAPEIARDDSPRDESNAVDRFLRRLFSPGGTDESAAVPAPAAQAEAPPPTTPMQDAAVVSSPSKDSPNGIDLWLRRLFAGASEPAVGEAETPEIPLAELASATPEPAPAAAIVAGEKVDPLSRALRNLFSGMAEKNVHAEARRTENPSPAPPIEVAEATGTIVSDRPSAEPAPPPAAILTPVPAAPMTFATPYPTVRRTPGANARAVSGVPPEAAAPMVVAENVLKPLIANPAAPSVEPAPSPVELAARPEPDAAAPPKPAPFKPMHRAPLSGVPLALGQTATIGRPWPAANLPPHSCMIKKAWNAGFCVEPIDWPAAALPIFDVNSPLYRGAMAVTRYEGGSARQYHTVFPAAMFGAVVGYFENNLGPATEEDMKTVAMPGQPALRNPIRRWVSADPQTGRKTAIEVRGFDDLRNFIPDAGYGVARLYEEGSGPVFEFLGTAELLLMRIKQTSAAFPTLNSVPATR